MIRSLFVCVCLLMAGPAIAGEPVQEPAPAGARKLGGHVGLGMPFLTVGTVNPPGNVFIGRDFVSLGVVSGINVGLDAHWSIDFEFIVLGNFLNPGAGSTAVFVLDPGVVYNWGPLWTGLRIAMRTPAPVSAAEFGFIPIIGKAFPITDKVAYYVELDLPIFIHAPAGITFTTFVQTGLGF